MNVNGGSFFSISRPLYQRVISSEVTHGTVTWAEDCRTPDLYDLVGSTRTFKSHNPPSLPVD